jgi:hypothetical protein
MNMNMKKCTLLFILLLFCAAGFAQSGTAGKLKWSLSGGTLTISGNGAMQDYHFYGDNHSPWSPFKENIAAVIIENGVTSIGIGAFESCGNLTSVIIPNSVTTIEGSAFFFCKSLTSIVVGADNPNYTAENGVLFNKAKTKLMLYPKGKTEADYTIPNSVTAIVKHSAFSDCENLTSVTIPNPVTTIGEMAFVRCLNLKDVTVQWTTPLSIESNVFLETDLTKCTLHVPSGTAARYRAADVWKDFGKIVEQ